MMEGSNNIPVKGRIWSVGVLCRAVADSLEARFNPVTVAGEITGFSQATSGHCYFSIKDAQAQIRCAMFRRAAQMLDFTPRDGEQVELRGRIGVYEQRGDLQLVVESMHRAGQGALFEKFLLLKAKLEAQGLFDGSRKRDLPLQPRGIGVVTSLGAAALHDVIATLQRRVPHIPVVIAPASVQGAAAPQELVQALGRLYAMAENSSHADLKIDLILLVRGGGAMEDLWAFNDEQLAHTLAQSPVPVISGIGHETDFTIADFVADLRAPTPTASAELVSQPRAVWLGSLALMAEQMQDAMAQQLDRHAQRIDQASARLSRPSALLAQQQLRLAHQAQRLHYGVRSNLTQTQQTFQAVSTAFPIAQMQHRRHHDEHLAKLDLRLQGVNPRRVLERGYAWLTDDQGHPITHASQTEPGQALTASLADGVVDLTVTPPRLI